MDSSSVERPWRILRAKRESAERLEGFQRMTLGDLQEALNDLMRGYEEAYGLRLNSLSGTNEGESKQRPRLPEDLRGRILTAERRAIMFASRVADDEVRETMRKLAKRGTVATWAGSFDRADDAFQEARMLAEKAMERTGMLMRSVVR
jgi:hypothetical protein